MAKPHTARKEVERPAEELGDVLDFMRLLWAVDHGLHTASKRMVRQVGITGPQRLVLRIVGRIPGITAGRLARILYIHPSTLTGVLQRLVEKGLVTRAIDPNDGRRVRLTLTREGQALDASRSETVEAAIEEALEHLSSASISSAVQVLLAIAEELGVEMMP